MSFFLEADEPDKRWVRRSGQWRREPIPDPLPSPLPEGTTIFACTADDIDRFATYADAYDGPEGLCSCCGGPLETVSSLVSGLCSPCALLKPERRVSVWP